MKFCIITHVNHSFKNNRYYGYAPYVDEMNLWLKYVDEVNVVAPLSDYPISAIHNYYQSDSILFTQVPSFSLQGIGNTIKTICILPLLFYKVAKAMAQADHIHLRCPGNMGLIGAIVQIFFPHKQKTTKYAGNWDPKSKQPLSYKLQQKIVSNTFITRNMRVLVYGEWENSSSAIHPFFTATYAEEEKEAVQDKSLQNEIKFVFVGSLSQGKQPFYALYLVREMQRLGLHVRLDIYGDGVLKEPIQEYVKEHNLEAFIAVKGNVNRETMKSVYKESHFLILPSKSEGWPKVVAEAMFWKCLPLATPVSCVPYMLDQGQRGQLLTMDLTSDVKQILHTITATQEYQLKINRAADWSRMFTINKFESEIKKLLTNAGTANH